jgi:beta-glucuronidase
MSQWLLMDFRSPRRPLPGIQDYYHRKGLLSDRGQRTARAVADRGLRQG